jgi:MFS family permease
MNMFYISGTAPIVPFLPVYARQLGFSGVIVGMIYTVLPITGMLANPIVGAIADRHQLQKTLFLAFQIITAISFFVIQFIPEIPTESTARSAVLDCDAVTYFRLCSSDIDSCASARLMAETSNNATIISCEVCMLCSAIIPCVRKVAVPFGYGMLVVVVCIEVAVGVWCCFTVFSC